MAVLAVMSVVAARNCRCEKHQRFPTTLSSGHSSMRPSLLSSQHCRNLRHHCCHWRKVVIHALHRLLSGASLYCYCCFDFVNSIHHGAHRRLQGCKLLFYLTVRVRKAGLDHIVIVPIIVGISHSICSFVLSRCCSTSFVFFWIISSSCAR